MYQHGKGGGGAAFGGGIAYTGFNALGISMLAVAVIIAGLVLLRIAGRRHRSRTSSAGG